MDKEIENILKRIDALENEIKDINRTLNKLAFRVTYRTSCRRKTNNKSKR